jgi:anion-transporting  ArsA/GET3 family ATPase
MTQGLLGQKLIFVVGKGGVGRSTCALALAMSHAARGERTLVVQWALGDALSPRYGRAPVGHTETHLVDGVSTMNFDADDAIREYFVDHLGMRLLHSVVIENKHVQRLVHAAPGVQELFYLGRLLWLTELAKEARGWSYDRIFVDTPATGHGVSLFTIAATIASFGMTGPLAHECERVTRLLRDAQKVGVVMVTLPEELPVEEALESIPRLERELGRPPLRILVNKSISRHTEHDADALEREAWYVAFRASLASDAAREGVDLLLRDLLKRNAFEDKLRVAAGAHGIPVVTLSDVGLTHPEIPERDVPAFLAGELAQ